MAETPPEVKIRDLDDLLAVWRAGSISAVDQEDLLRRLRSDPAARRVALHAAAMRQVLDHQPPDRIQDAQARRRWAPVALLAAAMLLLGFGGWWLVQTSAPAGSPLLLGPGVAVVGGGPPQVGAELRVSNAAGRLRLPGRAQMTLDPRSRVRIDALEDSIAFHLLSGAIRSQVVPDSGQYRITTPSGSVAVTGTDFRVERRHEENDTMHHASFLVHVLAGAVLVSGSWGSTALAAGEAATFPPAEQQSAPEDQVAEALNQRFTVAFKQSQLDDVLEFFRNSTGLAIAVDPHLLDKDVPITLKMHGGTVGQALRAIAWQTDSLLVQRPQLGLEDRRGGSVLRLYAIEDLSFLHSDEYSLQALETPVYPWSPQPRVSRYRDNLVVNGDTATHLRVQRVLEALRALNSANDQPAWSAYDAGPLNVHPTAPDSLKEKITFDFTGATLVEAIDMLATNAGLHVSIHPEVMREAEDMPPLEISAKDMLLADAIRHITGASGSEGVSIRFSDGVLVVGGDRDPVPDLRAYDLWGGADQQQQLVQVCREQFFGPAEREAGHWLVHVEGRMLISAPPPVHTVLINLLDHFERPSEATIRIPPHPESQASQKPNIREPAQQQEGEASGMQPSDEAGAEF